jgi:Tol biopolymer transport system component
LTDEHGDDWLPIWTPSGRRVVFCSNRHGGTYGTLFWKAASPAEPEERLVGNDNWVVPHSWSPDGSLLAFREINEDTGYDIGLLPMGEDAAPSPFLQTPFFESLPRFSPDGKWIAYVSDASGQREVYLRSARPGPTTAVQVSVAGGSCPLWSPDGREIIYLKDGSIMGAAFRDGSVPSVEAPKEIVKATYPEPTFDRSAYDIAPDGQRFVMVEPGESQKVAVVQNWFEELKRAVPTN